MLVDVSDSMNRLVLDFHNELGIVENGSVLISESRNFTWKDTNQILLKTEELLDKTELNKRFVKLLNFLIGENLDNIEKHSLKMIHPPPDHQSFFCLSQKDNSYYITVGNLIENYWREDLEYRLTSLNRLNEDELKELYKIQKKEGVISEKGGAGLGLIQIARKSSEALKYKIVEVSNTQSYFILVVTATNTFD